MERFHIVLVFVDLQMQNGSLLTNNVTNQFSRKEQTNKCASLRLEHAEESKNVAKFPKLNSDQKETNETSWVHCFKYVPHLVPTDFFLVSSGICPIIQGWSEYEKKSRYFNIVLKRIDY